VKEALKEVSDAEVWAEIQVRLSGAQSEQKTVKAAELETLLATHEVAGDDRPDGVFYARTLSRSNWDKPWMAGIEK